MKTRYRDRRQAGEVLAAEVSPWVQGHCVVAAIPRGGVVVAAPVAQRLRAPLTLVFARKLTLPDAPEVAVGALTEDGYLIAAEDDLRRLAIAPEELGAARSRVRLEIERQRAAYRSPALADLARGATVVLVDDGLATGLTMRAAVDFARRHSARAVLVAVPCASSYAAELLAREADRLVCPWVLENFIAVGAHYEQFESVSDDEVRAELTRARTVAGSAGRN